MDDLNYFQFPFPNKTSWIDELREITKDANVKTQNIFYPT